MQDVSQAHKAPLSGNKRIAMLHILAQPQMRCFPNSSFPTRYALRRPRPRLFDIGTARFARKESRKPDGQWSMSDTAGLQSRKAAKPQNMRPHSRKQQTMNPTSRTQHATAAHVPYSAAARQPMALCRESNAATPPRFTAAQPTHDTSHAAQHRGNSRTLVILYSRFLLASWARTASPRFTASVTSIPVTIGK